ncbi:hypothetical protein EJD97_005413 [Solanum chilense]|uniref:Uncharacterized protein n=1 Tax=Solanum chilense TaxID=4083 RepID=A0A6N2AK03_SOLCI|nr:hypothetical protein EJD97_005413 [Solanum chilense]
MVSDSELVDRIHEFLSTADLDTTTNNIVRRKLEEDFNIDLSDRKVFIREQIDLYLESYYQVNQEQMEVENDQEEDPEEDEEEEDPEEEEEESKAVDKAEGKSSEKKPGKKNESGKRKAGGFTKICSLSPQLQKITGEAELARTEVVKRLWQYINANELKNPPDKRIINCDDTLRELFGVESISMFAMNKALTKHIWPLDSDAANKKQRKQEEDEDLDEPKEEEKQKNSGMHAPLRLSNAF